MHNAAQFLVGEHDFTSFRASACGASHAVRNIHQISVEREGDEIRIEVTANAFLYHMVRNIAGSLMRVGLGDASPEWIGEVLRKLDRTQAAPTVAPEGLYFVSARYPEKYELPVPAPTFPVGLS
jgi:tRNA pseudouridine38-40 synthase